MTKDEFYNLISSNGLFLDELMKDQFSTYLKLLQEYNQVMNLTSIIEEEEVYEKHFYYSLLFSFGLDLKNKTLIDIGSGAGFPGLVITICYKDTKVTLLEPLTKRCNFLNEVIKELKLKNVKVVNARCEDYSKIKVEKFDIVVARAVSRLNILIEVVAQLVKVNGLFIALKGKAGLEEIKEANNAIKELGFKLESTQKKSLPSDDSLRYNLYLRKVNKTPIKYPRVYGQIKNRPL